MRICFVIRQLGYGGAERQLIALAKSLAAQRHDIVIIEFYEGGAFGIELENLSNLKRICLHKRGRWEVLGFFRRLVRVIRDFDPDVVHGYLDVANILAVLARPFLKRRPVVVMGFRSSHTDFTGYDWTFSAANRLQSRLARYADLTIANSLAGFHTAARLGFPPEKMVVIHNGIDTKRFHFDLQGRQRLRALWGVRPDEILIGLVARLDPIKCHRNFIEACARAMRERSNWRFVCVGAEEPSGYTRELKLLAAQSGLEQKLVWAGARSDMTAVYSALDLVTLCSASEGFPNAVAEAMACGVPCVAVDSGDLRQIIGAAGIIVENNHPETLLAGWESCLKADRGELGRQARARIMEEFSLGKLSGRTIAALLNKLV